MLELDKADIGFFSKDILNSYIVICTNPFNLNFFLKNKFKSKLMSYRRLNFLWKNFEFYSKGLYLFFFLRNYNDFLNFMNFEEDIFFFNFIVLNNSFYMYRPQFIKLYYSNTNILSYNYNLLKRLNYSFSYIYIYLYFLLNDIIKNKRW